MTATDLDTCLALVLAEDLAREAPRRRLTPKEASKVRSLIIDEGYTRTEALAEVRSW